MLHPRENGGGVGTSKARNGPHDIDAKGDALQNDQCKTFSVVVTP